MELMSLINLFFVDVNDKSHHVEWPQRYLKIKCSIDEEQQDKKGVWITRLKDVLKQMGVLKIQKITHLSDIWISVGLQVP